MKLESAHITNFKLLQDVELTFSTDLSNPLTVLRAENGSGKTSILFALRWALYGNDGIPPKMRLTSTAKPPGERVQVQVRVEFTATDPYSDAEASYRLIRTCEETPGDANQYSRTPDRLRLLRRTERGEEDIEEGKASLIASMLPLNLANVFFTNGDEVQRFIAGGQYGQRERQGAVHAAIRQLLGLDDVEAVQKRLDNVARRLRSDLTSSGGDRLKAAEEELDSIERDIEEQKKKAVIIQQRKTVVDEQIRLDERELDTIKGIGDLDTIQARIRTLEEDIGHLAAQELDIRGQMKELLRSEGLSRRFIDSHLQKGLDDLAELVDKKVIPGTSIEVLIDRLQLGICICGEELTAGQPRHAHVTGLIAEQKQVAPGLQRLTALWHEARSRISTTDGAKDERNATVERAASLNDQFTNCRDLQRRKDGDIKIERARREEIKIDRVQELTERLSSNRNKRAEFDRQDGQLSNHILGLEERQGLSKQRFDEAKRQATLNEELKRRSTVADDLSDLTKGTLDRLKADYVKRVSARMNELFLEMVGADPTADTNVYTSVNINESNHDIVINTLEGRTLDADTELNGAAQRALTLSLIWALMEVAEREAPRIIDTPLGMTSGAVKQRMVELLTKPVESNGLSYQVVLLMTRSEIRDIEALIQKRAGVITTLTCSKDYPIDLVNDWSFGSPIVQACDCDHSEVCQVCARHSDAGRFRYREAKT